jgi:hypothetical protein
VAIKPYDVTKHLPLKPERSGTEGTVRNRIPGLGAGHEVEEFTPNNCPDRARDVVEVIARI